MRQWPTGKSSRRARRGTGADMPRVAVLVDTSTSWGRQVHTGIHKYDLKHGGWQLFVEARGADAPVKVPPGWNGDGIIARVGTAGMRRDLMDLGIPVVNVSGIDLPGVTLPRVTTDLQASARLAARHFLERGFRHFAYFSLVGVSYVATHERAFAQAVSESGGDFASFAAKPMEGAEPDWNLDLSRLGSWLDQLPKPVAILTWNASGAREIMYACQKGGLLVPEQVSVLSGGDDDLLCNLLPIPLSGIQVAAQQIGYESAALLDRLMRGQKTPEKPKLIAPLGIAHRQSTDTLAIDSPAMVKALNYIRHSTVPRLQVRNVAKHAGVSRRVLERLFMEILGRAPAAEIRRVRLARAKELLAATDLPIPEIAGAAGFGSPEYLAYVLRREAGETPLNYRKRVRAR